MKDYNCFILYHHGKTNVIVDTLSKKSASSLAHISIGRRSTIKELHELINQGLRWKVTKKCLTCQQMKLEHQRPSGLLQQLPIPEWKWDMIAIDFMSGLPRTSNGYDTIWVIVDRLTKTAHFLPIKKMYSTDRLARLYVNRIVCLHGVPVSIVYDRGATFTSVFW